jgi:hypothetical protein
LGFDPEEIVQWPGVGGLTLRSAVQRVMAAPPENRMLMTLYRGTDKKPPLLELSDIEAISALSSPNNEKAGE